MQMQLTQVAVKGDDGAALLDHEGRAVKQPILRFHCLVRHPHAKRAPGVCGDLVGASQGRLAHSATDLAAQGSTHGSPQRTA